MRLTNTKCREMKTIDSDADGLRVLESVFDAIDAVRDRRKRPDRVSGFLFRSASARGMA